MPRTARSPTHTRIAGICRAATTGRFGHEKGRGGRLAVGFEPGLIDAATVGAALGAGIQLNQ
jgi:hypothetical protein